MTDGKSENHYTNSLKIEEEERSGVSDSEEYSEDEKSECQHPKDCDECSQSVTLIESLDTQEEKTEDTLKNNRLKIANELNEMNKMFLLSKLTENEIKDYIATNLTEDADNIRDDYFRLFDSVPFTDPIKVETYGLLVKLGILEQVKATHDDLYEPSKIKL
jgi:hypothetical protein